MNMCIVHYAVFKFTRSRILYHGMYYYTINKVNFLNNILKKVNFILFFKEIVATYIPGIFVIELA